MSYLNTTKDHVQLCYVGDKASDCIIALFTDASFAGDLRDSKSTSGGVLCLSGPKTSLGARGTMPPARRRYRPGMRDSELIKKHGGNGAVGVHELPRL